MNIVGSNVDKYGISTSTSANYNNKKQITISTSHGEKKYYGYVKYKDGSVKSCNISFKIDLEKPEIPTSEIRKTNSRGDKINNISSYINYRVWWGNFNSIDKFSGIDHYEFSTNCTGKKTGNLKNEYFYPSSTKDSYNGTYCIIAVDKAGNYSNWSSPYYFKVDLVKPTCSVKITSNSSNDTLTVYASDSNSGVSSYSYNNSIYDSSNVYKITKGKKVTVSVKDKAGNIGICTNYKSALILLGDSRTNWIRKQLGAKQILTKYDDIYSIESYDDKEIYAVTKSGATRYWLKGYLGKEYDSGAYQVQYLLDYLSKKDIYYDVIIASNLGVNDLNSDSTTPESYANTYITIYNNLLNSSQKVVVDSVEKNCYWKKSGNVISIDFNFISINPIDEKLLNIFSTSNKRTNNKINKFNIVMKQKYGNKYLDSSSKFNSWFSAADSAKEDRYIYKDCIDSKGNVYKCQDGLHYSEYLNKNYIYKFYKSNLLK